MAVLGKRKTSGSSKSSKGFKKARKDVNKSSVLGNLGGSRVSPSQTTLARAPGPFLGKKFVDFIYENGLTKLGGATTFIPVQIVCNSAYDVDSAGYLGNKQPLFYDKLLTAAGPYLQYKVVSWKTTWTIVNTQAVPLNVFVHGAHALSDFNTVVEAENFPGTKRLYLTESGGSKSSGSITVTGNISDFNGMVDKGREWIGVYNTAPGIAIGGTCLVASADGATTVANVYVSIKHEMYTELSVIDCEVS